MIDRDGGFNYSEVRVIKFIKQTGLTIAPNPANEILAVFHKNNAVIQSIQVLSMDGQVIKTLANYSNGRQINISNLPGGTYLLKVFYRNNEMEFARFVKI